MIHFFPIPPKPRKKCDTRALESARATVIADLTSTKLEKKFANEFVDRHNQRIRQNAAYRQTGEAS